ncbi:hypothetical protein Tco_0924984 [Tanacetum coccineum]|uniref:Uncharacterized protein n=1 Tax=Tanacetum coccineum TaxID=301880 RepID=A0ABQ5D5K0_9ASTR
MNPSIRFFSDLDEPRNPGLLPSPFNIPAPTASVLPLVAVVVVVVVCAGGCSLKVSLNSSFYSLSKAFNKSADFLTYPLARGLAISNCILHYWLGIPLGPRYKVGESSSAAAAKPAGGLRADYGFVATMDREIRRDLERDVGYGITDS